MGNKLLVIGGSGELGSQILRKSRGRELFSTYYSKNNKIGGNVSFRLDVRDRKQVRNLFYKLEPDVVVNASVSDRTIRNQSDKDAMESIIDGALNVAKGGKNIGARTIHISTDLVFDGTQGNYKESSPVSPLSFYGKCKAEMEERLLALDYDLAVVRTSLIITFDPMGHQVSWIFNALSQNEELRLYTDEYRSPILGEDLARAIINLSRTNYCGLINIAGPEPMNRYQLGCIIADYYGLDKGLIIASSSKESENQRPQNCTLNSLQAYDLLGLQCRKISEIS